MSQKKCHACDDIYRMSSDGEEVPRYARAACKCERREACEAKKNCIDKVIAVILEPDGETRDTLVCHRHLPSGFDAESFMLSEMVPVDIVEPPCIVGFEPTDVVCNACGHAHKDSERSLFFCVAREGPFQGKMIHRTGCPKCKSVFMNAQ